MVLGDNIVPRKDSDSIGNVLTRGAHVMDGYWGQPVQTKDTLRPDGWLDTGDVGWIDEFGQLWLLGRRKDVIKTGGENVYASEVLTKAFSPSFSKWTGNSPQYLQA